jgi:hypothetical protein
MRVLEKRLEALEPSAGGNECELCGFDGDYSKLRLVTKFVDRGAAPRKENSPRCGRPLRISINLGWGDL